MRLIDADAIPWTDLNDNQNSDIRVLVTFAEKVNRMPTIEERKKGKWIEQTDYIGDTYYDCSVCGESWTTIDGTPWENGMNFCPHCGARMVRGEEDVHYGRNKY